MYHIQLYFVFVKTCKVFVNTVRQEKVSWLTGKNLKCKSAVTYVVDVLEMSRFCYANHLHHLHACDILDLQMTFHESQLVT